MPAVVTQPTTHLVSTAVPLHALPRGLARGVFTRKLHAASPFAFGIACGCIALFKPRHGSKAKSFRPSGLPSSSRAGSSTTVMAGARNIALDPFAARNFFEPGTTPRGREFIEFHTADFERRVNEWYNEQVKQGLNPLKDGYAPFCKHLFVPNFVPGLIDGAVEITEDNAGLLRSEYVARRASELPVLARWFPKAIIANQAKVASFLDIILYSREQIREENAKQNETNDDNAPWGIVSIKPQSVDHEIPMEPITMMRNALGQEHGGSGVELKAEAYMKSVEFWNKHARVQ